MWLLLTLFSVAERTGIRHFAGGGRDPVARPSKAGRPERYRVRADAPAIAAFAPGSPPPARKSRDPAEALLPTVACALINTLPHATGLSPDERPA